MCGSVVQDVAYTTTSSTHSMEVQYPYGHIMEVPRAWKYSDYQELITPAPLPCMCDIL